MGGGLGSQDIGPLTHQRRRQADRQVLRQLEVGEVQLRRTPLRRQLTGEHRQQIIALRQLLLELRHGGLVGGQLALETQHVRVRRCPGIHLHLGEPYLLALQLDQLIGRFDLPAVGGRGEGRVDDVRNQRDVGCLLGGTLQVDLRMQALDHASLATEHIQGVAHRGRQREQIEDAAGCILTERLRCKALARRGSVRLCLREEDSVAAAQRMLTLPQARLGGLQSRIGMQGFRDHRVELWRLEQPPPVRCDCAAGREALQPSLRGYRLDRIRARGIVRDFGRRRPHELRTNRAAGQHAAEHERTTTHAAAASLTSRPHRRPPAVRDRGSDPWGFRNGR